MKKTLLSVFGLASFGLLSAQTIVSTTPSNRNAVLEDYTGIYCQFCPDGHKRAAEAAAANLGRVVLVNIHAGGFANPQAGDPDFRTPYGQALATQSGLTGYPSGTVNREKFNGAATAALSRSLWAGIITNNVLPQSSPVNVAVEANYNENTNSLDILVEAFYTSGQTVSSNNLNVAILQNNILGPQTGAATYWPEQIQPNGQYKHMHMLRDFVTGQWGEVITVIDSGTFVSKTYTWPVPANINGVPVKVTDLEVAAYIAEGQENIITGVVNEVVVSPTLLTDLALSEATTLPTDICANSIEPKVGVTNNFATTITSFSISYTTNTGLSATENFNGSLAQGQSTTISFPAVTLPGGQFVLNFGTPQNINGVNLLDFDGSNDIVATIDVTTIADAADDAPRYQDFESAAIRSFPAGTYGIDNGMAAFGAVDRVTLQATANIGAYEESDKSIYWFFWNTQAGNTGSILFDKVDLTKAENQKLTFDYAYTSFQGSTDGLRVEVSKNCGASWSSLWNKSGADLRTAPEVNVGTAGGFFKPVKDDWVTIEIDLGPLAGEEELIIRFTGTSDFGDNLYVDNINVAGSPLSIANQVNNESISLYPNPAKNAATLEIVSDNAEAASIRILNMLGAVVSPSQVIGISQGSNLIDLPINSLVNGIYFVETIIAGEVSTSKLIINK